MRENHIPLLVHHFEGNSDVPLEMIFLHFEMVLIINYLTTIT